jgi:predicted nucleotidyltransferase
MARLRNGDHPTVVIRHRNPGTKKNKMKPMSSTPYPDVNEILNILFSNVQEILGNQFVGMYLFGSLANGEFDEHSDIDVLVVTKEEISQSAFSALRALHQRINTIDSPWAIQIEASYIPQAALRRFDPENNIHPHMDRGDNEVLHWMSHESDWIIQRHILRERGIMIKGPDLRTLIEPVSSDELRKAVVNVLPLWVKPILEDPSRIKKRGYQSYCVLTLCRMLYTFKHGEILSKPGAATWALEHMDPEWKLLIERALVGRQNADLEADAEDLKEALAMMRYVLSLARPTPYPEVNELLNLLLRNAKRILGEQFVGMYLYGSLASGDFDPETSDIDFLVVTSETLPEEKIAELEAMHNETWAISLKRAGELEGSYVPRDLIRRHDPDGAPCPTVNEGKFFVDKRGSDWIIQRHVVREYGVVVEGPDPKTLIDSVSPGDIRKAVLGILQEWWFPMLEDPSWLRDHGGKYHAFAVITMCRVLHALEHGTIVSKPKAVQWARATVGAPWVGLIDKAVRVSRHEEEAAFLDDTLDFIRFIEERTRKFENLSDTEIRNAEDPPRHRPGRRHR